MANIPLQYVINVKLFRRYFTFFPTLNLQNLMYILHLEHICSDEAHFKCSKVYVASSYSMRQHKSKTTIRSLVSGRLGWIPSFTP